MSALSPQQAQAGEGALVSLEQLRAGALANVSSTWSLSWGSKDAALYFLETTAQAGIDSLRRRLSSLAAEGWTRWSSDAGELARSINQVVGYSGEWGMAAVLANAAGATGQQLGEAAQGVVRGAGVGTAVFVFVALAFVAWKVAR